MLSKDSMNMRINNKLAYYKIFQFNNNQNIFKIWLFLTAKSGPINKIR